MSDVTVDEIVRLLELAPLPEEGGLFRRTHRDAHSNAIYYLLVAGDFSALHRLPGPEVYHHYAGAPVRLLLLHPEGRIRRPVLGTDLRAGQRPQVVVPGRVWQGSDSSGAWSLLGTTMAPPFRDRDFELGHRADLQRGWPSAADRIAELTRP